MKKIYVLLLTLTISSLSFGQTVAYTSFEEANTGDQYIDTGDNQVAHDLVNNSGQSDVDYTPVAGALEIGFDARYVPFDTPSDGLTDGDFVGITDFMGTVGSFTEGDNGYQFSDTDGIMILEFDPVDLTAYTNIQVSLDYFVQSTGWEAADFIKIYVKDLTNNTQTDIIDTEGSDIDDLNIEGSWLTGNTTVLPDNIIAQLVIEFASNSGSESLIIDNVLFTSGAVPTITTSGSVNNLNYVIGNGPSNEGSFTIEGADLSADINLAAPTNFEISLTPGANFTSAITMTQSAGSVASTTVYTRLNANLTVDTYSGDITASSAGATDKTVAVSGSIFNPTTNAMKIVGVFDASEGSSPRGVEIEVLSNISDLSIFGIGSANNGGGTDGQEFTFPAESAQTGDLIYVINSGQLSAFQTFFETSLSPYESGALSINGDDAIELFESGQVIDVFGTIDCDPNAGSSTCPEWEHTDGWAYRNSGTGPDGSTFVLNNWNISQLASLDGTLNSNSTNPYPSANLLSLQNNTILNFAIHPNPSKDGFINITSTGSETLQATVFDILGKQVINAAVSNERLDVSTLNTGVYIVKLTQGAASTTKKLIIQ
jgi:hypothetical protein